MDKEEIKGKAIQALRDLLGEAPGLEEELRRVTANVTLRMVGDSSAYYNIAFSCSEQMAESVRVAMQGVSAVLELHGLAGRAAATPAVLHGGKPSDGAFLLSVVTHNCDAMAEATRGAVRDTLRDQQVEAAWVASVDSSGKVHGHSFEHGLPRLPAGFGAAGRGSERVVALITDSKSIMRGHGFVTSGKNRLTVVPLADGGRCTFSTHRFMPTMPSKVMAKPQPQQQQQQRGGQQPGEQRLVSYLDVVRGAGGVLRRTNPIFTVEGIVGEEEEEQQLVGTELALLVPPAPGEEEEQQLVGTELALMVPPAPEEEEEQHLVGTELALVVPPAPEEDEEERGCLMELDKLRKRLAEEEAAPSGDGVAAEEDGFQAQKRRGRGKTVRWAADVTGAPPPTPQE